MLSRYSVKKPYTVVVAIVLVIILGVVSFTKMSTDLLPSMNLPYAIVMTTYPGGSPETVETMVTKPIEQSMATVSNIKNVSSTSRESMSLVILEFEQTANMDSATIEMRENLDQLGSYWDDSVGNPMIMKLNPDMMPIVVAAVEVENMTAAEVTEYVEKNVQPELESIAGVARVTTSGTVEEHVDVIVRQEKVDQVNEKVHNALSGTFTEKEQELDEAQQEIDEGKAKLEDGKDQLETGKEEAASQIGDGAAQLNDAQNQILKGEIEINENLKLLEEKQAELDEGRAKLTEGETQARDGLTQLQEASDGLTKLTQAMEAMEIQKGELSAALEELQAQLELLDPNDPMQAEMIAQLEAQKVSIETAIGEIDAGMTQMQTQLDGILGAIGQPDAEAAAAYLQEQIQTVEASLTEIEAGKAALEEGQQQLDAGKAQLEAAKEQVLSGQTQLSQGLAELNTQQILASIEMSMAGAKIDSGSSALDQAQEQLKSGREQLEDAREQALDQSNLNNILTTDMVEGILAAENFSMPAGYLTEDKDKYLVRVGDKLENADSLEELVVMDMGLEGLDPIRLIDVADVVVTDNSAEVYANLNGKPGVMLSLEKQTGYSTGDVTDLVMERFDQLESENEKMGISVLMDQGIYIDMVVNSVLNNMLSGAVLAILILLFFLKDIRPTAVIACSIPISVVTALVLMYFSNITMNVISLSGLALGIGMLVDNSIVVIENIYRMRNEGIPAREAAIEGAKEVAGAITASTLTTVCVFAPIVFTEGITRQLFVDMGLTIAYSLAASLIVALTLVPMMSAGLLKKTNQKSAGWLEKLQDGYGSLLEKALHHRGLVLLAAVVILVGSAAAAVAKGTAFMPEMESTQVSVTVTMEKGTDFETLTGMSDKVISRIEDLGDIETIGAMASTGSMMGGSSTESVSMYLVLKEDKELTGDQLAKKITTRTEDLDCEVNVQTSSMDMSALGGSGIQIRIKGKELDTLQETAQEVAAIVEKVDGTVEVSDGLEETDKEFRVVVDKAKAMSHNLTVAQVFQEINGKLAEASAATTLSTSSKDYSVYVRNEKDENLTMEQLKNLKIKVKDKEGKEEEIKVSDIASFEENVSPQAINRDAQSRYMSVTAGLTENANIGLVSADIEKALKNYTPPEGYVIEMTGEDETINDAMEQLLLMLVLALVFMYLIMVAQFQSLLSPFIVMFTVPLAFTGGFLALVAADMEISVIAMVGFVMLSGIIVNNGIVLVDYVNQLRAGGQEKKAALVQAGKSRLRPIIMTALTTVLGLSTMAAGVGMGADMVQPMAVVTIGGLLYGTLLTLFVVPCIYDILNRKEYKHE